MGGGGGGITTSTPKFAPELEPLVKNAVENVITMANRNPVHQYVDPNQLGTAGVSPWQQMAMQALPQMAITPDAITQLGKIVTPMSQAAMGAAVMGDVTPAAQAALGMFTKYGARPGLGPEQFHVGFDDQRLNRFSDAIPGLAPYMPGNTYQQSIFPGMDFTPERINQILDITKNQATPIWYGTPNGAIQTDQQGYNVSGGSRSNPFVSLAGYPQQQ